MAVETIGDALRQGWRLHARCAFGRKDGLRSVRDCYAAAELDLATLVWTRGAAFPLSMLDGRLKCPACGSRRVAVVFDVPREPTQRRA